MWDIWRREDTPRLRAYLQRHLEEFTHRGMRLSEADVDDYIHSQVRCNSPHHCRVATWPHLQCCHASIHEDVPPIKGHSASRSASC